MGFVLYGSIAWLVAMGFGIPRIWRNLDEGEEFGCATVDGGLFGLVCGLSWPISLMILGMGIMAKESRDKWNAAQGGKSDE